MTPAAQATAFTRPSSSGPVIEEVGAGLGELAAGRLGRGGYNEPALQLLEDGLGALLAKRGSRLQVIDSEFDPVGWHGGAAGALGGEARAAEGAAGGLT
jgi:hypothetical protein